MAAPSSRAVGDAAKHLNERLTEVLSRHARIMEAGGMSTAEAAAAVMMAIEQLAFTAISLVALQTAATDRLAMIDRTLAKLMVNLMDRSEAILTGIREVEQTQASRRPS